MRKSTQSVEPDPDALEPQHSRQRRSRRTTIGALAVVAAIGLAAIASSIVGALGGQNPTGPVKTPTVAPGASSRAQPDVAVTGDALVGSVPRVDYVIDLNTGVMTPLPKAIVRSVAKPAKHDLPRYAASPDGSLLAYVGSGDEASPQIFIAGIDGSGIRQMTHDPKGVTSPAWSPDGTMLAYEGSGGLFVLDVATGEPTPIADRASAHSPANPSFAPDGSSLVYNGGSTSLPVLRTVPIAGGENTILFGRGRGGMADAANGSLSPDGSLVTMMGSEIGGPGALRFVANVDGTERRVIPGCWESNPAGTWSPDGGRIICSDGSGGVLVVDIATGERSHVAKGNRAIWLDRHTLLVEVWAPRGR